MYIKSDNTDITMVSEKNDIIEELRESILRNCHNNLEESIRGSNFIPSGIDLLYYHLQRINLNRKGSSYIGSPKWLKIKKATINPKNDGNKLLLICFDHCIKLPKHYKKPSKNIKN